MTRNYLLLSALASAAAVTSVSAQEADQGAELEEIVVTGSYLFTGLDSPSPVVVISGDDLVNTAPADLATYFFDNVPQNLSNQPVAQTENTGMSRDRAIRTTSVDLRGIGPENTLVLLNGRRTIPNSAPAFSGFRRTDINSLVPRIAIARTELLLDGGSALYGSDAVAGVINTVTRDDFQGFDFSLDSRFFEEDTSAKDYTIAAFWGAGNDTSHVVAAVEWHETDRLLIDISSGDFENNPDVDPLTGTGLQEQGFLEFASAGRGASSWVDPDCGNPAFGVPVLAHYPAYQDTDDLDYLSPNPFTGATGTGSAPLTPAVFCAEPQGFSPENIIQNDTEQLMAFVAGSHRLSDSLTATVELNFNRQRFNDTETWGTRSGGQWVPTTPAGFGYSIPVTNPGVARAMMLDSGFGAGPPPGNIYSPGETLAFADTMTAFQESDIWRAAFTLEGDINADWGWSIDASAAYNTVRNSIRDLVTSRYQPALDGLGGPGCDAATLAPGTDECY